MNRELEYSKTSLILQFFLFSHIGWLWEVFLVSLQRGFFVNRGFMYGPWLPVYGSGVVLLLILINRSRLGYGQIVFLCAAICGTLEYVTAFFMELFFGTRWWDYSGEILNFQGRTCVTVILVFGLLGSLVVCVAGPFCDRIIAAVPKIWSKAACIVLMGSFMADYVVSWLWPHMGIGITVNSPGLLYFYP